jgi:predicted DCC family thiol-disulfide oxidoreductase YuxK
VQFILRHEKRRDLHFAALDSAFGRAVVGRHPELRDVDSVVWLEPSIGDDPERVLVRSSAALAVASYLGGLWRLAMIARLVPSRLRDVGYDFIARHRHRLGGANPTCLVPTTEDRPRFLT